MYFNIFLSTIIIIVLERAKFKRKQYNFEERFIALLLFSIFNLFQFFYIKGILN